MQVAFIMSKKGIDTKQVQGNVQDASIELVDEFKSILPVKSLLELFIKSVSNTTNQLPETMCECIIQID